MFFLLLLQTAMAGPVGKRVKAGTPRTAPNAMAPLHTDG